MDYCDGAVWWTTQNAFTFSDHHRLHLLDMSLSREDSLFLDSSFSPQPSPLSTSLSPLGWNSSSLTRSQIHGVTTMKLCPSLSPPPPPLHSSSSSTTYGSPTAPSSHTNDGGVNKIMKTSNSYTIIVVLWT
ncbi:PREDICTED: transcription factor bHLH117-like [Camelina sativa]|uniref:Transcription factor bHLH117-like n=1 Tax=Camelina sativa TaxID=90675 RepID=A0ABM0T1H5_CAMSA|nr:PREDICTED: transcription factor bHLH117-like [Camelina sativa]